MLIIYRTNPGFEGQIQTLDRHQLAIEFDVWLETATPAPNLAYLDIDELQMGTDALRDLFAHPDQYRVDVERGVLVRGDALVDYADLLSETSAKLQARDVEIGKLKPNPVPIVVNKETP
jgi:hypothetical protein